MVVASGPEDFSNESDNWGNDFCPNPDSQERGFLELFHDHGLGTKGTTFTSRQSATPRTQAERVSRISVTVNPRNAKPEDLL